MIREDGTSRPCPLGHTDSTASLFEGGGSPKGGGESAPRWWESLAVGLGLCTISFGLIYLLGDGARCFRFRVTNVGVWLGAEL